MEDTTIEDVLKTFETFYQKQDYKAAMSVLLDSKSKISTEVWHYNMGLTQYKQNNFSEARYHFLMAGRAGMNDENIVLSQKAVEEKLDISRLEKPLSASDYLVKTGLFLAEGWLLTCSLLIFIIGLFIIRKSMSAQRVMLLFILLIIPMGLSYWIKSWPIAIVTQSVPLIEGPSNIFPVKGELPLGVVILIRNNKEWSEVVYPSRFSGWISSESYKQLENL